MTDAKPSRLRGATDEYRALADRLPHLKFVVSTTTTTGMGELRRKLPVEVEKVYYPIDRRPWVRRAFGVLKGFTA